ncbi:hypothetical protein [Aridibaculum aurantiacum]|uniref:hypothetical protein n=1 Tax=Aridibaculum aurantiacum TaxID=2810307 RepID=UPI001A9743C6|nr:hypothetical protein [Aridibaculum aurantiacum]
MKKWLVVLLLTAVAGVAKAQKVVYSEPDRADVRQTNFEIIGKVAGNILIYKGLRDSHHISLYDLDMKQVEKVKLDFLPERIINADFLAYPDFTYMFYQYQKKNIVYSMAAKINGQARIVGEPITMDTTALNFWASNKIYNVIYSEDKQKIAVFKVNSKSDKTHIVTTALFDKDMQLIEKHVMNIDMPERNDFLTEFGIDNDGAIVFTRAARASFNDNIQKATLMVKNRGTDKLNEAELALNNIYLDEIKIKVDNFNKNYLITSFYSKARNGNIDGLYTTVWDAPSARIKATKAIVFGEDLRNEAKGQNSMRTAFNDYFLNNIIVRKDGGFLVAAESFYTTGRSGSFNRMDYLWGSPFMMRPMDYYMFSPYSFSYPWWRWNSFNQLTRYHAQNVAVFSFDSSANVSWTNVVNKQQYDDETDAFIGYQLVNTGDQLHFLFNQQEKRMQLLSSQSITPSGEINRNPTLRNLDKGYDFMPRYGKQVGSRQIIFPCMYRNYLCFARLDL